MVARHVFFRQEGRLDAYGEFRRGGSRIATSSRKSRDQHSVVLRLFDLGTCLISLHDVYLLHDRVVSSIC